MESLSAHAEANMASRGGAVAAGSDEYPEDEHWRIHQEYAADLYGNIGHVAEIRGWPRSRFQLLRERISHERKRDASWARLNPFIESDWNAVLSRDGVSEEGELLLRLFVCTDERGNVELNPEGCKKGWPVHIGYRPLSRELFDIDPIRWGGVTRSGKRRPLNPQAVKDIVLAVFCDKTEGYWNERDPGAWTRDQIEQIVEHCFGEPSKKVGHDKPKK